MSVKPYLNNDGKIEFLGEIEARHRNDVRPATPAEIMDSASRKKNTVNTPGVAPAAEAKPAQKSTPQVTIPDMLHAVKSATTIEELEAAVVKYGHVPEVAKVVVRKREEFTTTTTTTKPVQENHSGNEVPSDDLTAIEGIGPGLSKRLNAAGITTFKALAQMVAEDLRKIIPATTPTSSIEQFQAKAQELLEQQ